jgi:hypothetical protein
LKQNAKKNTFEVHLLPSLPTASLQSSTQSCLSALSSSTSSKHQVEEEEEGEEEEEEECEERRGGEKEKEEEEEVDFVKEKDFMTRILSLNK